MCFLVKFNNDLPFLYQQESKLSADSDVDEDDANADDISKEILQTISKLLMFI